MSSACRVTRRQDTPPGVRAGLWRRALGAICALSLFVLTLATLSACSPRLPGPVALANTPAHGITIPAEIRHGDQGSTLVVVQVLIHGKGPYPMALDTGASLTLIDRSLADKVGLKVVGAPEEITGVGGAQRVTPVSIAQWSLGKAQLPAMTITTATLTDLRRSAQVDGLLGSDVLDRYGAITIDYTDSQVTLYQIGSGGATSG